MLYDKLLVSSKIQTTIAYIAGFPVSLMLMVVFGQYAGGENGSGIMVAPCY